MTLLLLLSLFVTIDKTDKVSHFNRSANLSWPYVHQLYL